MPVWLAWKPKSVEAPGANVAFQLMFLAVTWPLLGKILAFQALVMVCPPASVKPSDQPLTVLVPVLVIVMLATRPLFQALMLLVTRHDDGGPAVEDCHGDTDADADRDGDGDGLGPRRWGSCT